MISDYCKTLDRSPQLLSVPIILTPGRYPEPSFYQIISKSRSRCFLWPMH